MDLANMSANPDFLSRKIADLEPLFDLAKLCRRALIQITGIDNPLVAFKKAQSDKVAQCELETYIEAITELAAGIGRELNGHYQLTASKAERIYLEVRAFIRSLKEQLKERSQTYTTPPPQVGSRVSIWTVSGGLPTLGRSRP
ncbi:MAG TPA: hypothetical protein VD907_06145 [Verrucomicrobiae bacterium]|nr:hypothetical protein [Verrucomicrobiae bacterium]